MCDRKMVAETGDLRFDKLGRPRALMVDLTTTARPIALQTYPARVLYRMHGIRLSTKRTADLGYGVTADLFTAVDDNKLVTWDGLAVDMGQRIDRTARVGHLGGEPRRQRSLPAADWRDAFDAEFAFHGVVPGQRGDLRLEPRRQGRRSPHRVRPCPGTR